MDAETQGPAWDALRAALVDLTDIAKAPRAPLIGLGKAYAALTVAMVQVASAVGHRSLRYEAAQKALDLKTKKRDLTAFVETSPSEDR